jgi:ADP-dependent NAD(P)H-hydrate dehydratase / NAD(P)H-hydrate epimerase
MREIDRQTTERFGVPSMELMENAAAATARTVTELLTGKAEKRILVLCGKGNNGGDGAATARMLANTGARVDVVLLGKLEETKGDAKTNFQRLTNWNEERGLRAERESSVNLDSINFYECDSERAWCQLRSSVLEGPHDVIVDALFGTGLTRPVEGLPREAIRYLRAFHDQSHTANYQRPRIVSIDVPSGLDADSHNFVGDAVSADATVTMSAPKVANVLSPAADCNGRLVVADIGSPSDLIDEAKANLFLIGEEDARRWLVQTRYTPNSYKNSHGHAIIVAGSRGFTGAAALCANAAMRAGAGLVTVATPASAQPLVAGQVMSEVMTTSLAETDRGAVSDEAFDFFSKFSERADVLGLGPGLSSEDERTRAFVTRVAEKRKTPVVIDADGLNCLSPWPAKLRGSAEFPIVLTPHPGEMLRLMGSSDKSLLQDRVKLAREFAAEHEVILLLKGGRSLIAAPDGRVFVNSTGNAGLGTAGSGDTLTGIITGFLAQACATLHAEANALDAVVAALFIGGLASDFAAREIGMRAMTASDIRDHLGQVFLALDPSGELPIGQT